MVMEIGRLVTKIAGRDAGKQAVIVDILDENHVLIDGETRRRKCNIKHLEPLDQIIKIKKGASHEEVAKEFEKIGLKVRMTKPKAKTERLRRVRKGKTPEEKARIIEERKARKKVKKKKEVKKEVEEKVEEEIKKEVKEEKVEKKEEAKEGVKKGEGVKEEEEKVVEEKEEVAEKKEEIKKEGVNEEKVEKKEEVKTEGVKEKNG